jgi:hypothetical protein
VSEERNIEEISATDYDTTSTVTQSITTIDGRSDSNTHLSNSSYTKYTSCNFNYYWPLDDEHLLDKKEFCKQINIRKSRSHNYFNQGYGVTKSIHNKSSISTTSNHTPIRAAKTKQYDKKWNKTHLDNIKVSAVFVSQSRQEYEKGIITNDIIPYKMSQLIKRTPQAPVLSSINNSSNTLSKDDGWTTVSSKKVEKKYDCIYEQTSTTLLPTNLPNEKLCPDTKTPLPTSYILPITIKITKKKGCEQTISRARVLVAVLQSMQNVFPDTYIQPKNEEDENSSSIYNINMVKTGEHLLDNYFENAEDVNAGSLLARIYIKTNNSLVDYKKNADFCKYLSKERIILEEIRLNDVNPPNLGFFEYLIPDTDNLSLHTIRIRKYMPDNHPRFQLFNKTLYDSRNRGTRVVMVKCDKDNFDELLDMFRTLNHENTIKFFPWKEFTSMNSVVRDIAFQKVFKFNKLFRSVKISGFKDNEDNIPMKYKIKQTGQIENDTHTDPLETMVVSDYLSSIMAGTKTKLFDHVYEPIGGIRDTLVHVDNYTEAKEFAIVALPELARNMNAASRSLVFADYKSVENVMTTKKPWQPFTKVAELMEEHQNTDSQPAKRTRTEQVNRPPYPGWRNLGGGLPANNTSQSINNNQKYGTTQDKKPANNNASNAPSWAEIQRHVDKKINQNTTNIRSEIQEANKNNSIRMDQMDK